MVYVFLAILVLVGGYVLHVGFTARMPDSFSAREMREWSVSERVDVKHDHGKVHLWRPARPCGVFGIVHLRRRLRLALRVFRGDYDVVHWGERSGEAPNNGHNYRDLLDERRAEARPFAITLGEGEKPVLLPPFKPLEKMGGKAPICGISGSFVFGKHQFAVTAPDIEALRWLIRKMTKGELELNQDLCEEVLLFPSRHVLQVTELDKFQERGKVVPFPGNSTEVTQ